MTKSKETTSVDGQVWTLEREGDTVHLTPPKGRKPWATVQSFQSNGRKRWALVPDALARRSFGSIPEVIRWLIKNH